MHSLQIIKEHSTRWKSFQSSCSDFPAWKFQAKPDNKSATAHEMRSRKSSCFRPELVNYLSVLWIWFASFWRAAQVLAWNISKLVSSPNRSEQKRSSTATNQMQDRDMVEHILNYNEKQRGVKWEIRLKSSSAIKPRKNKKQMSFFNVTFLQFWFIFSTLFSLLCCNECSLHLRDASDAVRPKCKCCTDLWWKTEGRPNKPKW